MGAVIISKSGREYITGIGNIVSFLMVSSLFISVSGLLKLYFSFLFFGITPKINLLFAAFLVTYGTYSLNKLTDKEEDAVNNPARSEYVYGNEKFLATLAVTSYLTALLIGGFESIFASCILLVPLVTGIIYSANIFSVFGIPRLKDVFVVKSLLVALSWAIMVTFLPATWFGGNFATLSYIFFFFFIKSFVNTILFDIRDVKGDAENHVKTIPVVIGIPRTRLLLLAIQSILAIWLMLTFDFFSKYYLILIISIIYGYAYILCFCEQKNHEKFLLDVMVDGEWIIMWLLYISINSHQLVFQSFVIRF
ncbi:MAG: UbiA family prenyltransferase [Euryarchaeota archaeon]|nr:UbiA family prenyltransferase [Euryarchaeota archaeon]